MLVDDDKEMSLLINLALGTVGGWQVDIALSGEEAIAKASELPPDLFLLDVLMPDMSGPETLRALRTIPGCASTPAIFVSGKKEEELLKEASEDFVCGVLKKPFNPLTLKNQIVQMWESYHARQTS